LYAANRNLFTPETIALVRRAGREEPDSIQQKRLRYFYRYLVTEYIAKQVASLSDRISNTEAAAVVRVGGKEIPYRRLNVLIANEPSQQRRAALYRAADPVLDSLNTINEEILQTTHRIARELGYQGYNVMEDELKHYSLEEESRLAGEVLVSTDSVYRALLAEMLKSSLRLDTSAFYRYDVPPLFRGRQFDRYLPSSSMLDQLTSTYRGLGIDITAEKNLQIDTVGRPGKNPRAVCFVIEIPNDVRLSITPAGGFDDYCALFHEMGHGQHAVNTQEHAFEFKYLGEPTVTESYAFLSEFILANQAWLRSHKSIPTPVVKELLRFEAFRRLYYVRRYSAKLLYELQINGGADHPGQVYSRMLSEALGYRQDPSDAKRFLADVDPNYYTASYLRAWFLEAEINQRLTHQFGFNWFEYPQAGAFLRTLWARGDRLEGEELARSLGFGGIAPDAWRAEINAMILFSIK
jgi:hypothetical protein